MIKNFKKYSAAAMFALAFLIIFSVSAKAVTVSGTITDPAGNPWVASTYVFTFLPPPAGVPTRTGESTTLVNGVLNGSGAFSGVVLGNNDILGGFWTCEITAATGQNFTAVFRITATSSSLSTVISAFSPLLGLVPQTFTTIAGSITLATATPVTTRDIIGSATLSYAGVVNIGSGSGNVTGVRGVVTINSGTTVNSGYVYGTQGKVVVSGTLTTQSGGGIVSGVFGQLDISTATLTSAGIIAPGAFDMGASGPSASIANLYGVVITNSTATTGGAAIGVSISGGGFSNLVTVTDSGNTMDGTCTSFTAAGYFLVTVNGSQAKIPYGTCT